MTPCVRGWGPGKMKRQAPASTGRTVGRQPSGRGADRTRNIPGRPQGEVPQLFPDDAPQGLLKGRFLFGLDALAQSLVGRGLIIAAPARSTASRKYSRMSASRRMVIRSLPGGSGSTAPRLPQPNKKPLPREICPYTTVASGRHRAGYRAEYCRLGKMPHRREGPFGRQPATEEGSVIQHLDPGNQPQSATAANEQGMPRCHRKIRYLGSKPRES